MNHDNSLGPEMVENPLMALFHTIASASVARGAAAAAAAVQVEHYNQLIAQGLSPEVAIELTAKTTAMVFDGVSSIVNSLAKNGSEIGKLFESLERTYRGQGGES